VDRWLFEYILIVYFVLISLAIIRLYIEVIQVWMFPHLSTWAFTGAILALVYGYVAGGFRSVAGICTLSTIYTIPLLVITSFYPLEYAQFSNLLPFTTPSGTNTFLATKQMVPSYIGFQLLLVFYPFIENAKRSQKWAHYGNLLTTTIFLVLAIVSFTYYSAPQLLSLPWPTLTFWGIVQLPIIERFEIIGIVWWLFIILPNVCLGMWCASRGVKRIFPVKQRHALFAIFLVIIVCSGWVVDMTDTKMLRSITDPITLYLFYVYIPFLFIVQLVVDKIKGRPKN
jgi:hypothetical protein